MIWFANYDVGFSGVRIVTLLRKGYQVPSILRVCDVHLHLLGLLLLNTRSLADAPGEVLVAPVMYSTNSDRWPMANGWLLLQCSLSTWMMG